MQKLLSLSALVLAVSTLTKCNTTDTTFTSPTVPVETQPNVVYTDDPEEEIPELVQLETDEFMSQFDPSQAPEVYNAGEADVYSKFDHPVSGEVEKAGFTALLGWSMQADLVFQDNSPFALIGGVLKNQGFPDHCSLAPNGQCDGQFHLQAKDIDITLGSGAGDWLDANSLRGRCGSETVTSDGLTSEFYPCLSPPLFGNDRELTWFFDKASCVGLSASGATRTRNGIMKGQQFLSNNTLISFREVTSAGSAELLYKCTTGLPAGTQARGAPFGKLTPRLAVADLGQVTTVTDECETSGLPGSSGGGALYNSSYDFFYTSANLGVLIDWNKMFTFIAGCTTDTVQIERVIRAVTLHELMHLLGFPHDRFVNSDIGLMQPNLKCTTMRDHSMGVHQYFLNTIADINMGNVESDLDIFDEDLSCFGFSGQ